LFKNIDFSKKQSFQKRANSILHAAVCYLCGSNLAALETPDLRSTPALQGLTPGRPVIHHSNSAN
jgi:hypothetical protein